MYLKNFIRIGLLISLAVGFAGSGKVGYEISLSKGQAEQRQHAAKPYEEGPISIELIGDLTFNTTHATDDEENSNNILSHEVLNPKFEITSTAGDITDITYIFDYHSIHEGDTEQLQDYMRGTRRLDIEVTDEVGNVKKEEFPITVVDTSPPYVLVRRNEYEALEVPIYVHESLIGETDYLQRVITNNLYSHDAGNTLVGSNYFEVTVEPLPGVGGPYEATVIATDDVGNSATHPIPNIYVRDDISPLVMFRDNTLNISDLDPVLSLDDIVYNMEKTQHYGYEGRLRLKEVYFDMDSYQRYLDTSTEYGDHEIYFEALIGLPDDDSEDSIWEQLVVGITIEPFAEPRFPPEPEPKPDPNSGATWYGYWLYPVIAVLGVAGVAGGVILMQSLKHKKHHREHHR